MASKGATGGIPAILRQSLTQRAEQLIDDSFRPGLKERAEAAERHGFNYVVDLYTASRGKYFYICTRYRNPRPSSEEEHFEVRSPRLKYVGNQRFNLAYQRHNGQWCEVYTGLTIDEALHTIREEEVFWPVT